MAVLKPIPWIRTHPRLSIGAAAAVVILIAFGLAPDSSPTGVPKDSVLWFRVQRGPLTISLHEGGTIISRESFTVNTDLSEDTTFLWLIEEGSEVKAGDLLAELDDTYFTDRKQELDIQLIGNQSELARAENDLKVALNESEASISKAEVEFHLAEMELEKFRKGDYPQRLMELATNISIAREELQRAEDKLEGSRTLKDRGFITGSELQADTLAATRAQIKLQLAEGAKSIYEDYTFETELEIRATDVEQKRLTLEREKHQATSRQQFSKTDLANQRAELQQREARMKQLEKDIRNCNLYAPADGMVIYASTVRDGYHYNEPFTIGREVDERQDVFYIPSSGLRNAQFAIHESNLETVATGMTARVRVEAIPNAEFEGQVSKIAVMPDQDNEWANPNLKVFDAEVELSSDDVRLRTGMSCLVEVVIHRYDDVQYVPVQAVARRRDQPVVYVRHRNGTEIRPVTVGLSDNRMTAILEGLEPNDDILLSPPLTTQEEFPDPSDAGPPAESKSPT